MVGAILMLAGSGALGAGRAAEAVPPDPPVLTTAPIVLLPDGDTSAFDGRNPIVVAGLPADIIPVGRATSPRFAMADPEPPETASPPPPHVADPAPKTDPAPAAALTGAVAAPPPPDQPAIALRPPPVAPNAPTPGAARLDLNTASLVALNGLPGAEHLGRAIASHRPYRSVEELLTRKVLRRSDYDRVKASVAVE